MICIYHSRDLDGYCSGAIVKKKYPDAVLIGYDYGQPFPWDDIPMFEPVIMVDVSMPMADMEKLAKHSGKKLTWIDHHKSAIDEYESYILPNTGISGLTPVLLDGLAACELTWYYLFHDHDIPLAVEMLGKYDTWRKDAVWETVILPFQFGMRLICNSPETFPKELFLSRDEEILNSRLHGIIQSGHTILDYQRKENEKVAKGAFELKFEGLRAICMNTTFFNSDAFSSVYDESKHDVMIPFKYNGKEWICSLYTTKQEVDCSVLAKKYGGGGHASASGFQLDNESFNKIFRLNPPAIYDREK